MIQFEDREVYFNTRRHFSELTKLIIKESGMFSTFHFHDIYLLVTMELDLEILSEVSENEPYLDSYHIIIPYTWWDKDLKSIKRILRKNKEFLRFEGTHMFLSDL